MFGNHIVGWLVLGVKADYLSRDLGLWVHIVGINYHKIPALILFLVLS